MVIESTAANEGRATATEEASPTLILDPVDAVLRRVTAYANSYESDGRRTEHFLGVRGDHGSGKTHAIRYAMKQADAEATKRDVPLFQIYLKIEGPSLIEAYRSALRQISLAHLRRLSLSFIGRTAINRVREDYGDTERAAEETELIQADPEHAYKLFRDYFVGQGAVEVTNAEELTKEAGGFDDFQRALSYLTSPQLVNCAYKWLSGQPVTEGEQRQLGVSGSMASDVVAKWGLRLVAALFGAAHEPLIVYLDQLEKLVLGSDGSVSPQKYGELHFLTENIPRASAMLVLSGNEDTWSAMPRDLRARLAGAMVTLPILSVSEAEDLVRVYLAPSRGDAKPGQLPRGLYPFGRSAVREMVRLSSGNSRRLLKLCNWTFERAFPERELIDAALAKATYDERATTPERDRAAVARELEEVILARGLSYRRDFAVAEREIDFAILGSDGTPMLLLELSEALFHVQEAKQAMENLTFVEGLRDSGSATRFTLVVLGYVSPEVTDSLRRVAHDLIVYDPDTFTGRMDHILADVVAASRQTRVPPRVSSSKEYGEITTRLSEMVEERVGEQKLLMNLMKVQSEELAQQRDDRRTNRKLVGLSMALATFAGCLSMGIYFVNQEESEVRMAESQIAAERFQRLQFVSELTERLFDNTADVQTRVRALIQLAGIGETTFGGVELEAATLTGAVLPGVDLRNAKLTGADLRGADLANADLGNADLRNANLRDATLDSTDLSSANPGGAIMDIYELCGALRDELTVLPDGSSGPGVSRLCR